MFFNSLEYLLFLPTVFLIYWFVLRGKVMAQNALMLVVSYVFYGWWDWRFLSLLFISSLSDYGLALLISRSDHTVKKKLFLALSMTVNLGLLGFFKYYNFFVHELAELLTALSLQANISTLNIILPVGISFYTFQTMSYTIDVYRGKIQPTHSALNLFAFVSFFPQLVAGPIERASNLLPQFEKPRSFDFAKAVSGLKQILWGLVKKVVIADSCASHVSYIFENYSELNGSLLLLGAVYFAFQIYGDFSGYSDIAIGSARLFGFDLMRNFAYPYFSRDIAEFWRRWHISLSTWFRDYLYIPLGGSRGGQWQQLRNVFAIFLVSGFWHGANWTFIAWGALNALYFLPMLLLRQNRNHLDIVGASGSVSLRELLSIAVTFTLTCLAWVFFRADSFTIAVNYIAGIFSADLFSSPGNPNLTWTPLLLILPFVLVEWFGRKHEIPLLALHRWPRWARWSLYYLLICLIAQFSGADVSFIYFQF